MTESRFHDDDNDDSLLAGPPPRLESWWIDLVILLSPVRLPEVRQSHSSSASLRATCTITNHFFFLLGFGIYIVCCTPIVTHTIACRELVFIYIHIYSLWVWVSRRRPSSFLLSYFIEQKQHWTETTLNGRIVLFFRNQPTRSTTFLLQKSKKTLTKKKKKNHSENYIFNN